MAAIDKSTKQYDYGNVHISLENCILPEEKLTETPSMKDGLDKDMEVDLRILGCEFIQTAGILLKLPQVAMATGQILLQRFYYAKSLVKHDVEICAMACIFLAAKIEESPRRLRDIINVFHHIKQKRSKRNGFHQSLALIGYLNATLGRQPDSTIAKLFTTVTPMDYFSNAYFALKNNVIKAERRVLKELGFCVHVKHPHKVIITYLQILEHERNTALAQKAWNYMNDSLRTDVFLRFAPEKIGCACIFLAARVLKVVLPQKPPWWELFDTSFEEIDDIALTILRLYARPKVKMTKLDDAIENAKKLLQDRKEIIKENGGQVGTPEAFTPSHVSPNVATGSSISTKISSKTNSPLEIPLTSKSNETKKLKDPSEIKKPIKKLKNEDGYRRSRSITPSRRKNARVDSGSSYESDSDLSSPDRKRNTKKDRRARNDYSSDDSDADSHRIKAKDRRNDSEGRPKSRLDKENGHRLYNYEKRQKGRSRSRSRSRSRDRRDKNRDKRREKKREEKSRYNERENRINYDRYDKKGQR